jgi:hypothetical protein
MAIWDEIPAIVVDFILVDKISREYVLLQLWMASFYWQLQ